MDPILRGMLIGAICGGLGVVLIGLVMPQKKCPDCGEPLPKFRKPKNARQMFLGGWTCAKCGIEIDRRGKKRSA